MDKRVRWHGVNQISTRYQQLFHVASGLGADFSEHSCLRGSRCQAQDLNAAPVFYWNIMNYIYIDCLWQLVESRYIRIVRGVWCRFWPLTLHIRHITCSYMSPCICAWFRQSTEDSLLAPEAKVSEAVWKQKAGLPAEQWCGTSQCLILSMSWDVLRFGRHEVLLSCPLQRR